MTARCLLRATARQTKVCTSASSGHIIGGSIRLSSLRAGVTAGPASSSSSRSAHGRSPFRVAGSTAAAHLDLAASWFLRPLLQDCCSAWRAAAARPGRCTIQNAGGLPLGALQQSRLQHRCTAAGIPNITHTIYTWSGSSCRSISSNTHTNTSSSSSSDPSQPTPLQQAAAGSPPSPRGPYREGYGGKVAIPSQELLQQPLLSSAATVRARAYHIGWHIHIGKLAEHARRAYKCRTQAGKDYVIIALPDDLLRQQQGVQWHPYLARGSARYTPRDPGQRLAQQAAAAAGGDNSSSSSSSGSGGGGGGGVIPTEGGGGSGLHVAEEAAAAAAAAAAAGAFGPKLNVLVVYRYGSVVFLRCPAGSAEQDTEVLQRLLQPSMIYHDRSLGRAHRGGGEGSSSGWAGWVLAPLLRWYQGGSAPRSATPQQELVQVGADPRGPWAHQYGATPAYQRYKAGLWQGNLWGLSRHWGRLKERAALLKVDLLQPKAGTHALLPLGPLAQAEASLKQATAAAAAVAGGAAKSPTHHHQQQQQQQPREEERLRELSAQLRLEPSVEEYSVVVDPRAKAAVAPGQDCLRVRVLDVGNTRVITSLLAQSVALDWYTRSVSAALEAFQDMRQRGAGRLGRDPSTVRDMLGRREAPDRLLQQVLANAALVSMTARSSLEMTEPAWQYDAYHDTWAVMAAEFDLHERHAAFGTKLTRLEKEARFDVKWRHGQRYQNLSRAVELLLMFSVMLALWKAGIAFLEQLAAWTVEHDSLGEQQEEEEAG